MSLGKSSFNLGSHNPFYHARTYNDNLMSNPDDNNKPASQQPRTFANPREALLARIENDFTYHAPKPGQAERYQLIRDTAKKLARVLVENCPPSRELSTALSNLEAAVFTANAAIARNE